MCHWSSGDKGSDEKGTSGGWACVCLPGPGRCGDGADAVGQGVAWSPALSLHHLCSSGQARPLSLVVGPWHLSIPLCATSTQKRSSRIPQAQPLLLGVIWAGPLPPRNPSWCSIKLAPAHTPPLQLPNAQASPLTTREVSHGAFAPTLG